jgi:Uma2 family endonuclease
MMPGMGDPARKIRPATLEDLLAVADDERGFELIDGELVQKELTSFRHGRSLSRLDRRIGDPYDRPAGRRGPGGWWIATDVDVEFASDQIYRPDIAGWRRERMPARPTEFPVKTRPDWICEVLSQDNIRNDTIKKFRNYHRFEVPHYWILDPMHETLTVHRWTEAGYLVVVTAERGDRVRAEPFDAVVLDLDDIFDDVPEEEPPQEPAET